MSRPAVLEVHVSLEIDNIFQFTGYLENRARKHKFNLFDGAGDAGHNGTVIVALSLILLKREHFFCLK